MATYKSTMRSLQAAARRAERDAARRQRELERERQAAEKLEAQARAAYEVALFENHLQLVTSLHRDIGPELDWEAIVSSPAPSPPAPVRHREDRALAELEAFKPGRLLKGRSDRKRAELEDAVAAAIAEDGQESHASMAEHEGAVREHAELVEVAEGVLARDANAYVTVLDQMSELGELSQLGERLSFAIVSEDRVAVTLDAHSDDIIPDTAKSLLASGKLSEKKMPVGRRWELYQDHVCSAAIRAARDVFGLLPVSMTVVTVVDQLLNSSTGYREEQPILSVAIPRPTLDALNLDAIDPSDSMKNFVHRMSFMKTKGFKSVEPIDPSSLD